MNVRAVEEGDAAVWAELRARLWPHARARELAVEVRDFLTGVGTDLISAAFIAEEPGAPLGFLELSIRPFADGCDSRPIPHVEGWYVVPFARGRGVGRALMESAEQWARFKGFIELASDTEIHNDGSLAAHVSCGFVETERLIKFRKRL
jgi:aminoglycoside 6'-N-acetyltransferase I